MDRHKRQTIVFTVITFGAIWGIVEATLGHFIHIISLGLPGFSGVIMFPIAVAFMYHVYRITDSKTAVILTASVAALLKLVDLFVPVVHPIHSINPALAILMEAFALFVFLNIVEGNMARFRFAHFYALSIFWRLGFIAFMGVLAVLSMQATLFSQGLPTVARFLLIDSGLNAVILAVYFARVTKHANRRPGFVVKPAFALLTLVLAIAVNYII